MALIEMNTSMPALEGNMRVWDTGQVVNVSDELAVILCSEPEDYPRATLRDDLQPAQPAPEPKPEPGPGTIAPTPRRGTRRTVGPEETR